MIHTILQCLSAKTTAWNKFSSTMASVIIYLADNQKFNFSKYIFDNMVKSLEGRVKFYLFSRFLQVFLDKQVKGMVRHKEMYVISSHTKKIFTNIRRICGFSGGMMIKEIDQNAKITLDDETQGRTNDDEIFRVDDLAGEEVIMDSAAPTTDVTKDKITMAQALAALKSVKPKVVVQEQEMSNTILDKGKAKMIEPEVPLKKKDQIGIDEEFARKLQAKEQEAARLSRAQQDEDANNSWDNIQAMIDSNRLLAERLQARKSEEFS
nr:hypothetical protein [Tanacetum cinerariifolium]